MDSRSSLLILGLGNLLCSDDGLGAFVAQEIAGTRVDSGGREVLDGGTLGLALLPYLEDAERAILVDAIQADEPAGTLVRLEGDDVGPAVAARLSVHQVGVSDLIEAARWRDRIPPTLVLLGIVPETTELGVGLSPRRACRIAGAGRTGLRGGRAPWLSAPERGRAMNRQPRLATRDPADRVGVRLLQPAG